MTAQPRSKEARRYYRVAMQRFGEAELLYQDERFTTAAVYLAGYGVECMLKALVLSSVPSSQECEVLRGFHGAKAHDYEWLLAMYRKQGDPALPKKLVRHFTTVNSWSTDMRYSPRMIRLAEAKSFVDSAAKIMLWADGRIGQ